MLRRYPTPHSTAPTPTLCCARLSTPHIPKQIIRTPATATTLLGRTARDRTRMAPAPKLIILRLLRAEATARARTRTDDFSNWCRRRRRFRVSPPRVKRHRLLHDRRGCGCGLVRAHGRRSRPRDRRGRVRGRPRVVGAPGVHSAEVGGGRSRFRRCGYGRGEVEVAVVRVG